MNAVEADNQSVTSSRFLLDAVGQEASWERGKNTIKLRKKRGPNEYITFKYKGL